MRQPCNGLLGRRHHPVWTGGVVPPAPLTLPQGSASTFEGSVATRGAQPGATVVIKDVSGDIIGTATSDALGNYSLAVDPLIRDNAGPFLVQVTLADQSVLFSLSPGTSIVNVSPLEDGLLRAPSKVTTWGAS